MHNLHVSCSKENVKLSVQLFLLHQAVLQHFLCLLLSRVHAALPHASLGNNMCDYSKREVEILLSNIAIRKWDNISQSKSLMP